MSVDESKAAASASTATAVESKNLSGSKSSYPKYFVHALIIGGPSDDGLYKEYSSYAVSTFWQYYGRAIGIQLCQSNTNNKFIISHCWGSRPDEYTAIPLQLVSTFFSNEEDRDAAFDGFCRLDGIVQKDETSKKFGINTDYTVGCYLSGKEEEEAMELAKIVGNGFEEVNDDD